MVMVRVVSYTRGRWGRGHLADVEDALTDLRRLGLVCCLLPLAHLVLLGPGLSGRV